MYGDSRETLTFWQSQLFQVGSPLALDCKMSMPQDCNMSVRQDCKLSLSQDCKMSPHSQTSEVSSQNCNMSIFCIPFSLYVAECCSVLQSVAVCCSGSQWVAVPLEVRPHISAVSVCCNVLQLFQYVAMCYSALQCLLTNSGLGRARREAYQCCYSVLQRVAVCHSASRTQA